MLADDAGNVQKELVKELLKAMSRVVSSPDRPPLTKFYTIMVVAWVIADSKGVHFQEARGVYLAVGVFPAAAGYAKTRQRGGPPEEDVRQGEQPVSRQQGDRQSLHNPSFGVPHSLEREVSSDIHQAGNEVRSGSQIARKQTGSAAQRVHVLRARLKE